MSCPNYNLLFTFSSREELGCLGAKELVRKFKPDLFIGIDVTFATDNPDVGEREVGRCCLGKGPVIFKGINIDKVQVNELINTAKKKKINIQMGATHGCGTNAGEVANENTDIKVLDIGIPLRNMHTPVEVVNLKDAENCAKLLQYFLTSPELLKNLRNK